VTYPTPVYVGETAVILVDIRKPVIADFGDTLEIQAVPRCRGCIVYPVTAKISFTSGSPTTVGQFNVTYDQSVVQEFVEAPVDVRVLPASSAADQYSFSPLFSGSVRFLRRRSIFFLRTPHVFYTNEQSNVVIGISEAPDPGTELIVEAFRYGASRSVWIGPPALADRSGTNRSLAVIFRDESAISLELRHTSVPSWEAQPTHCLSLYLFVSSPKCHLCGPQRSGHSKS